MHPDRLNAVDPFKTVQSAYAALSGAQRFDPQYQILGAAVLFLSYSKRLGLDPFDLLHKAERIKDDADFAFGYHARALDNYIDGEIRK
jgi:hypothetical protein